MLAVLIECGFSCNSHCSYCTAAHEAGFPIREGDESEMTLVIVRLVLAVLAVCGLVVIHIAAVALLSAALDFQLVLKMSIWSL